MWHRVAGWLVGASLFVCGAEALAAARVSTLEVDLAPKIDLAAKDPDKFAVPVAHLANTDEAGEWQRQDGTSVWRYSVRIPTAVSLSFHARHFKLPAASQLRVSASNGTTHVYGSGDGAGGELWSRLHRGDTLNFELRVPTLLESQAEFELDGLQAGYRGLGGGAPDHPHFRKLEAATSAAVVAACSQSFACHETAANSGNAAATAAIVIDGQALCTATLVNNLRNDGTPYLLSARHCRVTSQSNVVVYWDAVTPCGAPLGNVYDAAARVNTQGAETVFVQQDTWLMRLNAAPNGVRPYFAGWDATGGVIIGGYSPHHALGRTRQYTGWFGQAVLRVMPGSALGVGYESTYWGLMNSVGNVGSGASGGGLFNPDHRLVGVASLAYIENATHEGVCPVASPPAPTAANAVALYNSLSAIWETNADTTSHTNPVTLKSLLDPDNTGNRVVGPMEPLQNVNLAASASNAATETSVTLTWDAATATSCTASGGTAGDGWAGARATSGTFQVSRQTPGISNYTLRCGDGTRFGARTVSVSWYEEPPSLSLSIPGGNHYVGDVVRIDWAANVSACVASGGAAGDGWAGARARTGSVDVTLTQQGASQFTLTCGTGSRQISRTVGVDARLPLASLRAIANNLRIGNDVVLLVTADGTCVRTGGVPGDGWTTSTSTLPFRTTASTAGTYRFTLTCGGGSTSSSSSVDVVFTNAPPTATLTSDKAVATAVPAGPIGDITGDSPFTIKLTWDSNIAPCVLSYDGPGSEDGFVGSSTMNQPAAGTLTSAQNVPGTYIYRITCAHGADTSTATTTVEFQAQLPYVSIITATEFIAANEPVYVGWSTNASPCTASGGFAGDGWAGPRAGTSGSTNVTPTTPGTYTYTLSCGTAPDIATGSVSFTLGAPAVAFETHDARATVGTGVILRWHGTVGPCVQTDEWANAAERPANSGNVVVGNSTGVKTYGVRCGTTNVVEASTQVEYVARPTVDITASSTSVAVNQPVTLNWTSANTDSCSVQGTGFADWQGTLPISGSRAITRTTPGSVGFYINCNGEIDAVVVEWRAVVESPATAAPPGVTLSIDQPARTAGQAVTLTWTSERAAACFGSQGVNGDGWAGALAVSGSRSIVVNAAGTYTWEITCEGAPPSATASVSATYAAAPSSSSSSGGGTSSGGGGGGGGGRFDPLLLAMLGFVAMVSAARVGRQRRAE
jgi:hypothetical protein